MHARANLGVEQGLPIFSAEDNVYENLAERLRHVVASGRYEAGFQPAIYFADYDPRALPWAGMSDAFGVQSHRLPMVGSRLGRLKVIRAGMSDAFGVQSHMLPMVGSRLGRQKVIRAGMSDAFGVQRLLAASVASDCPAFLWF